MQRALAWLYRCRAILVRYDKKVSNYIGLIRLACVNADEELVFSTCVGIDLLSPVIPEKAGICAAGP